jgi:hypothetical protein
MESCILVEVLNGEAFEVLQLPLRPFSFLELNVVKRVWIDRLSTHLKVQIPIVQEVHDHADDAC